MAAIVAYWRGEQQGSCSNDGKKGKSQDRGGDGDSLTAPLPAHHPTNEDLFVGIPGAPIDMGNPDFLGMELK